ncbi:MAG: DUF881 domain-containing protein [Bacillus sp. (in: firmicutes)]
MDKKLFTMTIITLIIGFMIAVQFRTVKEPELRDTRDSWQLREDMLKEKEMELKLLEEIRSTNDKLEKYKNDQLRSKEQVLQGTIAELKEEIGLIESSGPGLVILIEPVNEEILLGEEPGKITADLLRRLINELNMYGAKEIAINEQRLINTTSIRDINNVTKIDGYPLDNHPIKLKIITENMENAEKLYNRMKVSKSADEFFVYNLLLTIKKPAKKIKVPAYQNTIAIRFIKPVKEDTEGGGS